MTKKQVLAILERFPTLTGDGFGLCRQALRETPPEKREAERRRMIAEERRRLRKSAKACTAAAAWLTAFAAKQIRRKNYGSYGLKHSLQHETGLYVTNGEFIIAAIHAGLDVRPEPHPGTDGIIALKKTMSRPRPPRKRLCGKHDREHPPRRRGMIGRWFHSHHEDGRLNWQGQILARPESGIYLVQLFSWFTGDANGQKLVPLADMKGWTFYDTAEEMNEAYYRQTERTK